MNEHNVLSLLLLHVSLFTVFNLKYDVEHFKVNDYDSKTNCTVIVYNLFQSLFLHLLTNKFHSHDFKCEI